MTDKIVLAGLVPQDLAELLGEYPPYRCKQLYKWILSGAGTFSEMSNLPLSMRNELEEKFLLLPGAVTSEFKDSDETLKIAVSLKDGSVIESVMLSDDEGRKTACLSTQAGCPMHCIFCKTGSLGFKRNLTATEISGQFLHLLQREEKISNIVIMGMGEPLLNLEALRAALDFFMHPGGLNISKRRITISTCGLENGIRELADKGPDVRLALSLSSGRRELRERLMPASRENPLPQIKDALQYFQRKKDQRITLEMVLLSGLNTGEEEADAVAEFARGLDAVVNLIPWNRVEGLALDGNELKTPSHNETAAFADALKRRGLRITRRYEKGGGISAACGQLGSVDNFSVPC